MRTDTPVDFSKLESLLARESFPQSYTLKLVGKNTERFHASVALLEASLPGDRSRSVRTSAQGNHASYTFLFTAESAEQITGHYRAAAAIPDLMILL